MTVPFHPLGVGKVKNKNTTTSATNTHKNAVQISSNILIYYPIYPTPNIPPQNQSLNPNPINKIPISLTNPSIFYIQLPGVYNIGMDQLSGANYQAVLKYMQTVNEQNFETAVQVMKQYEFNLQMAVNQRFQPQNNRPQQHQNQDNDEEVVRRYVDFLQKKNNQWNIFSAVFDVTKYIIVGILSSVVRLILPSSLFDRFFGNPFQKIYNSKLQTRYNHRKYTEYLAKTKNLSSKTVLVVISPRREHPQLISFLNDAAIQKKIHLNYFLCCYVIESDEIKNIEGFREGPQIIALRWNIFEEIVEVGRERDIKNVNVDLLGRWTQTARNLFKRDNNVLVKYRNLLAKYHGLQYQQEQEEEVNLVQRDMERQEITQQDRAYREAEERAARARQEREIQRRKEEEQASKIRQLEEERQMRKMSIPDQPTSGQIIRISFRCPDGSTVLRNFLASEKLELIYHWIQLNDSIQFEDPRRNFELMYSFPPQPLSSKKNHLLSQVFESQQEKVVIRQL